MHESQHLSERLFLPTVLSYQSIEIIDFLTLSHTHSLYIHSAMYHKPTPCHYFQLIIVTSKHYPMHAQLYVA